ncbi:hypothetical protein [Oligoflexus tunisiensis]|uniref:hypothetical protein n=1 Tax=Oligoflexus tunisiensis TaxID=708132 RepID=UPI00114CD211|nr:hypothetical protein [Oligoflexus tunisiensis]
MIKKLAINTLLYLFLPWTAFSAVRIDLGQEENLVLRFTGPEAQRLTEFLKERFRQEMDFGATRYHGERMSLACSEHEDCYLWLSRKEWLPGADDGATSTVLTFTLPLKQTTLSGRLSLTAGPEDKSTIQLQLQDPYYPGAFSFKRSLNCPVVKGVKEQAPLHGNGDCRLELSSAPGKGRPYPPSAQFVHNLDNIVLSFQGPWARKLLDSAPVSGVDPYDPERIRAQLGPELYCWNLDPLGTKPFLNDSYACQVNLRRQDGENPQFSGQGAMKGNKDFALILQPDFRNGILKDFDLHLRAEGNDHTITHCPNYGKNAGFGQCTVFYDMKIDVDLYPIGNAVQGVAVGWGVSNQKN